MVVVQSTSRTIAHGGIAHGALADDTRGMINGDEAIGSGAQGAEGEQMGTADTDGPGGRCGTAAMSVRSGAIVPED